MFKILDRYIVREVLPPFFLGLVVLTFLLLMPPMLEYGEQYIEKGVPWPTVAHLLATLIPQALALTIPIALLLGILVALGRLSADREFVAMQACGISIFRLVRPMLWLAIPATAATLYVMIVLIPDQNQAFREITFRVVASAAESDLKPRVFFQEFPNQVLYVRDVPPESGWLDVFMADTSHADQTIVYLAKRGRLAVDRTKKTVELVLEEGSSHATSLKTPDSYEGGTFDRQVISLDAASVFRRSTLLKGDNEMSIAELRTKDAEAAKAGLPQYGQYFVQNKFSIPAACLVLALVGLTLGVTNRKDGKFASFVLGFVVVFIYQQIMWTCRGLALTGRLSPGLASWIPNIVIGAAGIVMLLWRAGSNDRPIRLVLPSFVWLLGRLGPDAADPPLRPAAARRRVVTIVIRMPRLYLPRPRLLDLYIMRQFLRVFGLASAALLGIFYIATLTDFATYLFRGTATTAMVLQHFYFETPRYVTFLIPLSALIATLVVFGLLTKNSELIVMRACGVSLYRSAIPVVLLAVGLSAAMYEIQERLVPDSHRRAEELRHVMRGLPAATFGTLERKWIVGHDGDIYHYENFDPRLDRFNRLTVYDIDPKTWRLESLTYAKDVGLGAQSGADDERPLGWVGREGWTRSFSTGRQRDVVKTLVTYAPFAVQPLTIDPPSYFKTEDPEPDRMSYEELNQHITQLRASGFHVVPYMVQLQRKIAFPFVPLIMTLLAVPFAVTTGRRGALYGIGIGIVLAITYWTTQSVFAAIGAGGVISPVLAAWAPNILFGAAAAYMILTVRT